MDSYGMNNECDDHGLQVDSEDVGDISDNENNLYTSSEPESLEEEKEEEEEVEDSVRSLVLKSSRKIVPNRRDGKTAGKYKVPPPSAISTPSGFYHKSVNARRSDISMEEQITPTLHHSIQRSSCGSANSLDKGTPPNNTPCSSKKMRKSVPSLTPTLPKRNKSRHPIVGIGSSTNPESATASKSKTKSSNSASGSETAADGVVYQDKLGEITNLLGSVVERLERIEEKFMKSSSSSGSSSDRSSNKKLTVPHKVRTEVRMTYKTLLDDIDGNFTGFDTSSEVTYKHRCNQDVASHLLQEVQGSNPNFSISDIKAATYTYYKSLCQEATLRRKGVYEDRKIQRRRRERVIRRLNERTSEFNRMSYSETDKQKWKKVLISSFISSDESDMEEEVPVFIVKELKWRSEKVTKFFRKLDDAHQDRISEQAQRQTKPRLRQGRVSHRPVPSNIPLWAVAK